MTKRNLNFSHAYRPTRENGDMLKYSPDKIIALRKERGWGQSELARRAGMSAPSLWALENGRTKMPKFHTLQSLAITLGVPIQAILADKQAPDLDDRLAAATSALSPANKAAILGAAEALLKSQKPPKK